MKTKTRTKILFVLIVAIVLSVFCMAYGGVQTAYADDGESSKTEKESRLFTNITLDLAVENGRAYANARNAFTLGFATVEVYVYLYSSDTYTELIDYMTLEDVNYIADLNIYQTVSASQALNGSNKFWRARTRFLIDNGTWQEKSTLTYRIDPYGKIFTN